MAPTCRKVVVHRVNDESVCFYGYEEEMKRVGEEAKCKRFNKLFTSNIQRDCGLEPRGSR